MQTTPFFSARDPSIAQSIYNLGYAYLGPEARRRDAQDALDAAVGSARIRNLESDTGFNQARTTGQTMTNDNRRRRFEAAKARGYDDLTALIYAGSENTENDARAGYLTSGQQQRDVIERVNTEQRFAGERNTADIAGAMERARLEAQNRMRIAEMEARSKEGIEGSKPVIASDGSTVLFAPNDRRIPVPVTTPATPSAPAPQAPQAPAQAQAPATLGTAFSTQPAPAGQGPIVQGNTVRIPEAQRTPTQADVVADQARRVGLFKSRTDAWNDVNTVLQARAQSNGLQMPPEVSGAIVDAAVRIAEANGFQTDANTALALALDQLKITFTPAVDGWFSNTPAKMMLNGAEAQSQAVIDAALPRITSTDAGKAMFDRLPSGSRFVDPNGQIRIKP